MMELLFLFFTVLKQTFILLTRQKIKPALELTFLCIPVGLSVNLSLCLFIHTHTHTPPHGLGSEGPQVPG